MHTQKHTWSRVQHELLVRRCWLKQAHAHTATHAHTVTTVKVTLYRAVIHTHTWRVFFFLTHCVLTHFFSLAQITLHILYCCVKSHSLLTSCKFVLSTGAHTQTHTHMHALTNATVTRPSLHSQGERRHQHHTHSPHFSSALKYCM